MGDLHKTQALWQPKLQIIEAVRDHVYADLSGLGTKQKLLLSLFALKELHCDPTQSSVQLCKLLRYFY